MPDETPDLCAVELGEFVCAYRDWEEADRRREREGQANAWQFAVLLWGWTRCPTAPVLELSGHHGLAVATIDVGEPCRVLHLDGECCGDYLDRLARLRGDARKALHVPRQRPAYYPVGVLCAPGGLWDTRSGGRVMEWAEALLDDPRLIAEARTAREHAERRMDRVRQVQADAARMARAHSFGDTARTQARLPYAEVGE